MSRGRPSTTGSGRQGSRVRGPDGSSRERARRSTTSTAAAVALLVLSALSMVASWILTEANRGPSHQAEMELSSGDPAVHHSIAIRTDDVEEIVGPPPLLLFMCALGAPVSLGVRFRRARGDDRRQLKWVAYAG